MQPSTFLLFVEDDPHFAAWANAELARHCPDLTLRHASSLAEARAWVAGPEASGLQLAVIDLHLGRENGVVLIAELSQARPELPILVLTSVDTPDEALRAIQSGAQGYLLKVALDGELGRAVDQVRAGGSPINPGIAHLLLKAFRTPAPEPKRAPLNAPEALLSALSARETEVLNLIARGYSDKEAAARLRISPSTVDTHVRAIYRKFSVHSRAQLRGLIGA